MQWELVLQKVGEHFYHTVQILSKLADLLVCVALGVDMVRFGPLQQSPILNLTGGLCIPYSHCEVWGCPDL